MTSEIVPAQPESKIVEYHQAATSPAGFVKRLKDTMVAVQEAKDELLKDGTDYGTVGGTDKPTLLQPGAELLLRMFSYSFRYEFDDRVEDWDTPFFRYSVRGIITDQAGNIIGEGPGEANSKEPRYLRRRCPVCESNVWDNRKKQAEGKFTDRPAFTCKNRGCSWKGTEKPSEVPEIFDFSLVNTMMKMAVKRAKVAATLTATGGSHFFTQDVEDLEDTQRANVDAPAQTSRGSQGGSNGSQEQQYECEACGSKVYDNRQRNKEAEAKGEKKWPAFKCANKECVGTDPDTGEVVGDGKAGEPFISWSTSYFAEDTDKDGESGSAGFDSPELEGVSKAIADGKIAEGQVLAIARRVAKEGGEDQPTSLDAIGTLPAGLRSSIAAEITQKADE